MNTNEISYLLNERLKPEEFIAVLEASTLGERRPVGDIECISGMLRHADLLVSARHRGKLIGVSRSVTDFHYCCYLSDLAVDRAFQRVGIGRELVRRTSEQLKPGCSLILLSAPAAADYYPRIGFAHHPQAWIMQPGDHLID